MSEELDTIQIQYGKNHKTLNGLIKAIEFENDGYHIVYLPSLKISSYGKSKEEAEEMMKEVVIKDFCETLMDQKLSKVLADLHSLGFKKRGFFETEMSKSAHVDKEGILKDFDLAENTQFNESMLTV